MYVGLFFGDTIKALFKESIDSFYHVTCIRLSKTLVIREVFYNYKKLNVI
ncbi:hypothetical protein CLERM_460 [Coxiella-like endosymbiont]|nr:hypothetical protein CLERM_460 [Coxiella-like endosymbiont]